MAARLWGPANPDAMKVNGIFSSVQYSRSRAALLSEDPALRFVLNSFDGDLYQGLSLVVDVLNTETRAILDMALSENKTLFAVHVIVVVIIFYVCLFQATVRYALREVVLAREFVVRMPLHILSSEDFETFQDFFRSEDEIGGDRDDEDE
uniref:Uncharacterized protein n=2 Tax=Hemiselmis andersenii TaxID=464988 RepID=A0A7S1HK09_HEMAN